MKITKTWQKAKKLYLCFKPQNADKLTYTLEDELEMFLHESIGSSIKDSNGFYWCKHNMDITLAMWREDLIAGNLFKFELLTDPLFEDHLEWLENWLNNIYVPENNLQYRYDTYKKEQELMHEECQKLIDYLEEEKKKGLVSVSWTLTHEQASRLTPQVAKEMLAMLTAPLAEDPDFF